MKLFRRGNASVCTSRENFTNKLNGIRNRLNFLFRDGNLMRKPELIQFLIENKLGNVVKPEKYMN